MVTCNMYSTRIEPWVSAGIFVMRYKVTVHVVLVCVIASSDEYAC